MLNEGEKGLMLGSDLELASEEGQRRSAASVIRRILQYEVEDGRALTGIELFGGSGEWVSGEIFRDIDELVMVELDPDLAAQLRVSFPTARILCEDSIQRFDNIRHFVQASNVVSVDNPSAVFGKQHEFCEHFDVLEKVLSLAPTERRVIIYNVNVKPFNLEKHPGWALRRNDFYGPHSGWTIVDFIRFYWELGQDLGRTVEAVIPIPRRGSFLFFFIMIVR